MRDLPVLQLFILAVLVLMMLLELLARLLRKQGGAEPPPGIEEGFVYAEEDTAGDEYSFEAPSERSIERPLEQPLERPMHRPIESAVSRPVAGSEQRPESATTWALREQVPELLLARTPTAPRPVRREAAPSVMARSPRRMRTSLGPREARRGFVLMTVLGTCRGLDPGIE
jgi:hypothetical protein